jgi:hypothetical protein
VRSSATSVSDWFAKRGMGAVEARDIQTQLSRSLCHHCLGQAGCHGQWTDNCLAVDSFGPGPLGRWRAPTVRAKFLPANRHFGRLSHARCLAPECAGEAAWPGQEGPTNDHPLKARHWRDVYCDQRHDANTSRAAVSQATWPPPPHLTSPQNTPQPTTTGREAPCVPVIHATCSQVRLFTC